MDDKKPSKLQIAGWVAKRLTQTAIGVSRNLLTHEGRTLMSGNWKAFRAGTGGLRSQNSFEHDSFIRAIASENWPVINLLLKKYGKEEFKKRFLADGHYKNVFGATFTPLKAALEKPRVAEWLLNDMNVDVNIDADEAGENYLMTAAFTSDLDYSIKEQQASLKVIELLVKKAPHLLNAEDKYGKTALLHTAESNGYKFRLANAQDTETYTIFEKKWAIDKRCGPYCKRKLLERLGAKETQFTTYGKSYSDAQQSWLRTIVLRTNDLPEIAWAAQYMFEDTFRAQYNNRNPEEVRREYYKYSSKRFDEKEQFKGRMTPPGSDRRL